MTVDEQVMAAVDNATKPIIEQMEQMLKMMKENAGSTNSTVIKDARLSKEFLDSLTPAQRELLEQGIDEQEELNSKAEFEKFIKERQAEEARNDAHVKVLKEHMM